MVVLRVGQHAWHANALSNTIAAMAPLLFERLKNVWSCSLPRLLLPALLPVHRCRRNRNALRGYNERVALRPHAIDKAQHLAKVCCCCSAIHTTTNEAGLKNSQ